LPGELEPYRNTQPVTTYNDADYRLSDDTRKLLEEGLNDNTRRAYTRQWIVFGNWCTGEGRVELPATAETLAEYVTHLTKAKLSPTTIQQAIATVRHVHTQSGYDDQPAQRGALAALKGYRKRWANQGKRHKKATPILLEPLVKMVETCDLGTPRGVRDRAILLVAWPMMARRSEVANLWDDDVVETPRGLLVYVAMSKTDQDAQGSEVAIPAGKNDLTNPVLAVRDWRAVKAEAGVVGGKLFRSINRWGHVGPAICPDAIGRIVKQAAVAAGLPNPERYSAHGMRAGSATQAHMHGKRLSDIARQGRWSEKSATVLGYIRGVDQWDDNPMEGIGL
jgi:integrase